MTGARGSITSPSDAGKIRSSTTGARVCVTQTQNGGGPTTSQPSCAPPPLSPQEARRGIGWAVAYRNGDCATKRSQRSRSTRPSMTWRTTCRPENPALRPKRNKNWRDGPKSVDWRVRQGHPLVAPDTTHHDTVEEQTHDEISHRPVRVFVEDSTRELLLG